MNKVGGVSWNTSVKSKRGVLTQYKCKHCGRMYKMEWAKISHEQSCPSLFEKEKK